jgi:hypothetical protein
MTEMKKFKRRIIVGHINSLLTFSPEGLLVEKSDAKALEIGEPFKRSVLFNGKKKFMLTINKIGIMIMESGSRGDGIYVYWVDIVPEVDGPVMIYWDKMILNAYGLNPTFKGIKKTCTGKLLVDRGSI